MLALLLLLLLLLQRGEFAGLGCAPLFTFPALLSNNTLGCAILHTRGWVVKALLLVVAHGSAAPLHHSVITVPMSCDAYVCT